MIPQEQADLAAALMLALPKLSLEEAQRAAGKIIEDMRRRGRGWQLADLR